MKSTRWRTHVNTLRKTAIIDRSVTDDMAIRMDPADRRAEILDAALRAATAVGFMRMTRDDIARAANTSPGLVSARLGTMRKLRDAVMQHAIKREALQVIAEGVALRHPHALKAPADLQARAVRSLVR